MNDEMTFHLPNVAPTAPIVSKSIYCVDKSEYTPLTVQKLHRCKRVGANACLIEYDLGSRWNSGDR